MSGRCLPPTPARPVAVLDACVLYQGKVTDFLLWLADAGSFDPVWSETIHDEWARNLATRLSAEKIAYRRAAMDRAFPGALCPADTALVEAVRRLCRNDRERKDAHVVATAKASGASVIVTHNIADFSGSVLDSHGLRSIRPDDFCADLFACDPAAVLAGARSHRLSMVRSAFGASDYLAFLAERAALPRTAAALGAHRSAI